MQREIVTGAVLRARRAHGRVVLARSGAKDRFEACRAEAPLVLRTLGAPLLYLGQLGGGYVDGDDYDVELEVKRGATLVVRSQASTKVYPGRSSARLRARVEEGATLMVENEPLVPYAGSRYVGSTELDVAAGGSVCFWDAYTAGRVAGRGERWQMESFETALSLRREGVLVVREAVRLTEAVPANAFALLVVAGPRFEGKLAALDAAVRGVGLASFMRKGDVAVARIGLQEPGKLEVVREKWLEVVRG